MSHEFKAHKKEHWETHEVRLSSIPLKVRKMESLALMRAAIGLLCWSLKLCWASAKALTDFSLELITTVHPFQLIYKLFTGSTPRVFFRNILQHSFFFSKIWQNPLIDHRFGLSIQVLCERRSTKGSYVKWGFSLNRYFCLCGPSPWALNHRCLICHLWNVFSFNTLHGREWASGGVMERGCGPVTGQQVSCGRLGGVSPSRMMGWLIQQHLRSGGRDFSQSHKGITKVTEFSALTYKVDPGHKQIIQKFPNWSSLSRKN